MKKSVELKIKYLPSEEEYQYHICAVIYSPGDQIGLLGVIETDKISYELKWND